MIRYAALAAAAFSLTASPAAAQSLFGQMKRLCIDTGADPAAALAAAEAAGMSAAPPEKGAKKPKRGTVERVADTPRGKLILNAETAKSRGSRNHTCMLTAVFTDPDLPREAQAWAGVPVKSGENGLQSFAFLESGGKHLPADAVGEMASLADTMASLRFLGFGQRSGVTFISYTVPAKSPN